MTKSWRSSAGSTPYNSNHGYVFPYAEELHPTRWTADTAIASFDDWYARRSHSDLQPLLLKLSFHRPHSPYDPPDRLLKSALERIHDMPRAATGDWDTRYISREDCTAAQRTYCGQSCGFTSYCGKLDDSDEVMTRAFYYASVAFVDEQAGRVLARVRSAQSVWRRTFVAYLSDHGDALGDHHLWRKGYAYEQVASIPLFIRWPTSWDEIGSGSGALLVTRGTVLDHLVELRDIFPTLADAAGITLAGNDGLDGKSVLPLLRRHGPLPTPWRDVLMLELAMCNFDQTNWVALTDGRTKYIWHINRGEEQLFDLSADPSEQHDLALDVANATGVAQWRERLVAEFRKEGRGPLWISSDDALALPRSCEQYETLTMPSPYPTATQAKTPRDSQGAESPAVTSSAPPNVVFFLSDDQDLMLGGANPHLMRNTQRLIADQGATATNFFAHSPICGPSRAQLLTGRYFHNLRWDPTAPQPRPRSEHNCMHVNTTRVHDETFARPLHEAGYTVGLFGKWLNWPADWRHLPRGFDVWFANGGGDYLSPKFFALNLAHLGYPDGNWQGGPEHYSTSVIGNVSTAWLREVAPLSKPFFAYIGVKAAHEPFTPAPWYTEHWDDAWPDHEPRPANYNCSLSARSRHHGCIRTAPLLTEAAASVITGSFKNRWRTLLSLDDLVAAAYEVCQGAGVVDRTYFISTSDHGFQLGQFNIPMDKRHVYDWDTRIPFFIRGPGISPGSTLQQPATLVDLAPTFLSLAGLPKPPGMDGRSLLPLLVDPSNAATWNKLSPRVRDHLAVLGGANGLTSVALGWRKSVFLTHYFYTENIKCVSNCTPCSSSCEYHDSNCADARAGRVCWSTLHAHWAQDPTECAKECFQTESRDNNFIGIRHVNMNVPSELEHAVDKRRDVLYAEFQRGQLDEAPIDFSSPNHVEYFDVAKDAWMLHNLHGAPEHADDEAKLHEELWRWFSCEGETCP